MYNEEDIYKEHPHLRECVAAIRAVAGPGEFFSHPEHGCAGWHWGAYTTEIAQARGYRDYCFIDLDRDGAGEPFRLFSLCGDDSAPDGPANDEEGNAPTPELAAACARWLMETPIAHETTLRAAEVCMRAWAAFQEGEGPLPLAEETIGEVVAVLTAALRDAGIDLGPVITRNEERRTLEISFVDAS